MVFILLSYIWGGTKSFGIIPQILGELVGSAGGGVEVQYGYSPASI